MVIISEGVLDRARRGAVGIYCLRAGNLAMLIMWGAIVISPTTDILARGTSFTFFRMLAHSIGWDAELVMGIVALSLAVATLLSLWRGWVNLYETALLSATVFWGVLLFGAIVSLKSTSLLAGAFYLTFLWFSLAGWALSSDKVRFN